MRRDAVLLLIRNLMHYARLLTSIVTPLIASIAMAANGPPDGALLISHLNSQQWQLRLIGGGSGQRFSGVVESNAPFTSVNGAAPHDLQNAKLWSSTELAAALTPGTGGSDRISFSVSSDAQLCLRDTGSAGIHMYLGDRLPAAMPVTAPLALTRADACGESVVAKPFAGSPKKYHPGHYIAMLRDWDSQAIMATSIKPGVVGFLKRYSWRALEPTPGAYQLTEIQSDLAWAKANGMHLVVMVEDKTFVNEIPTPPDLDKYAVRNHSGGGYTTIRWAPVVQARFIALETAIGARFDSTSSFEGIATEETAPGLYPPVLAANGYTPQKYLAYYTSLLPALAKSMPTSRVFWFMNFFPVTQSDIGVIAKTIAPLGALMGGPDVWPDNPNLEKKAYPYYTKFEGQMPLFGQVESTNYSEPHLTKGYSTKYWTMEELFDFAVKNLHVDYIFWQHLPTPAASGAYCWLDALPVIASNPPPFN
jgi:hypothetical protein